MNKLFRNKRIISLLIIIILLYCSMGKFGYSKENIQNVIESTNVITRNKGINVLMLVPKYFGALAHRVIDIINDYGWNITFIGVSEYISACNGSVRYWDIPPLKMDYLISEISDISSFLIISLQIL